jgi:hypothetical protein
MKVYTPNYRSHAGKWIYTGFRSAWNELGYDVEGFGPDPGRTETETHRLTADITYPKLEEAEGTIIMTTDGCIGPMHLARISKSHKTFVYAQPNKFPQPWGSHPNFSCLSPPEVIDALNSMDNVYLWNFMDDTSYHAHWKEVHTLPLAYDSLNYAPVENDAFKEIDICFVGGWANNGFDEKRRIMMKVFGAFMKSDLKCGFFIEKNLSHEQECALLYNSKVSLNLHDAYQRKLGLDTNERTFKSLGLNGILVSDSVGQLNRLFPDLHTSLEPEELVQITKDYLSLTEQELNDIKNKNRQDILNNHTYIHRIEEMLKL